MYPHTIRLRGPWEMTVGEGPPLIVKMPTGWNAPPLADVQGQVQFLRKFGAPRQLDEGEFVWLIFRDFPTPVEAELNAVLLGRSDLPSFAFPAILDHRNRLRLTLTPPADRACSWGEVAMEIRRAAWLADLVLTSSGPDQWQVSGAIVGSSPEPLELYVMQSGRQLHYQEIMPRPAGQPFQTTFSLPGLQEIRVELVNVATVWYSQILQAPG